MTNDWRVRPLIGTKVHINFKWEVFIIFSGSPETLAPLSYLARILGTTTVLRPSGSCLKGTSGKLNIRAKKSWPCPIPCLRYWLEHYYSSSRIRYKWFLPQCHWLVTSLVFLSCVLCYYWEICLLTCLSSHGRFKRWLIFLWTISARTGKLPGRIRAGTWRRKWQSLVFKKNQEICEMPLCVDACTHCSWLHLI